MTGKTASIVATPILLPEITLDGKVSLDSSRFLFIALDRKSALIATSIDIHCEVTLDGKDGPDSSHFSFTAFDSKTTRPNGLDCTIH